MAFECYHPLGAMLIIAPLGAFRVDEVVCDLAKGRLACVGLETFPLGLNRAFTCLVDFRASAAFSRASISETSG